MNTVPICYCGNKGIFDGILLSLLSIRKHTESALDVMLLTMDLSEQDERFLSFTEEQRELAERALKEKNPQSRVRIIDVTKLQLEHFDGGKNQVNNYTPYASIRLFLDLIETPEKLIYLDADVMCLSDIQEYYDIDIEEYEFAATLDYIGHHFFPGRYCNSGVMLLNMPMIRKTGLFERSRELIRNKKMLFPDQSAINALCERKLVLPYRFNEQRSIKENTVFKHFCMRIVRDGLKLVKYNCKQWHRSEVTETLGIHDFDDIYEEYDRLIAKELLGIN